MAIQDNITLTRRLFDELFTKNNLKAADEVIATNVKLLDPAAPNFKGGLNEFKERESVFIKAFPNKTAKIDDIFGTEDRVVFRWTCTGVHKGDLQGIAPTNKNFKISGISIYRFNNGKITEIIQMWDRLGLLEQIGEVEPTLALHR